MNEVKTFAKAGETAGAAVGAGVKVAREGAVKAGKQLSDQFSERGGHQAVATLGKKAGSAQADLANRLGGTQGALTDYLSTATDVLGDKVFEARRELAHRIEPPQRRRWPLIVLGLAGIGVIAGAAAAASRKSAQPVAAMPDEPDEFGDAASRNGAALQRSVSN